MTTTRAVSAAPSQQQVFKVALASIIGSVIEQYDFLVTGVIAATVWGGVYFKLPGLAAVAAIGAAWLGFKYLKKVWARL